MTFDPIDPNPGGALRPGRGEPGGETGEDAAPHRVLPAVAVARAGRGGAPSRPLSGTPSPSDWTHPLTGLTL